MRIRTLLLAALIASPLACEDPARNANMDSSQMNRWLVAAVNDIAIRNAIVRQHTLFPYHFVVNGSDLNALGGRDLGVLVAHYRQYPGQLNVRRGDADGALYQRRVKAVQEALAGGGVDVARVMIADAPAGGEGRPGEQVIIVMARRYEQTGADSTQAAGTSMTITSKD